jgi:chromosomal replication initiator protein
MQQNNELSSGISRDKRGGALHAHYTFSSFVVGSNSRFAHAAAVTVADRVTTDCNPLFIYGDVGLGKTHLLHAIGNHMTGLHQSGRVLYLSSEEFVNELIRSLREDRMGFFREKYRHIDLLLIDDIQFLAGKERMQEEFFHTFNTLYHEQKQIVLTSDCPPQKISTLAEQLRSRFEWGVIADIQPPDVETRLSILREKANLHQMKLPDDVALYIARNVNSNIRQLEGCLAKIKAFSTFNCQDITLEAAQMVLHDLFDSPPKAVTIEQIQQTVADHYQIEVASMISRGRSRDVTLSRQIAMYLARELTNCSLPDIGRQFGGRDHSTVLHACKKVERIQAHEQTLKGQIRLLRERIGTHHF